ncbi:hypothetical protein [Gloeothece verrucosa]|uniref:hypothetical protein n=1 Tax=Gloeothece verrucosa TaxID=2546359 RepID=UPI00017E188B|nr:hypothetical protein [Gloeothece verrucosa]
MPKNILKEDDNTLVRLDYSDLLNTIITVLQEQETKNPFKFPKDKKLLGASHFYRLAILKGSKPLAITLLLCFCRQ